MNVEFLKVRSKNVISALDTQDGAQNLWLFLLGMWLFDKFDLKMIIATKIEKLALFNYTVSTNHLVKFSILKYQLEKK